MDLFSSFNLNLLSLPEFDISSAQLTCHGLFYHFTCSDFLPVFNVVDLANGQVSQFNGKYGLKIVGGGPTSQSITDYSEKDQENYNFKTSR